MQNLKKVQSLGTIQNRQTQDLKAEPRALLSHAGIFDEETSIVDYQTSHSPNPVSIFDVIPLPSLRKVTRISEDWNAPPAKWCQILSNNQLKKNLKRHLSSLVPAD